MYLHWNPNMCHGDKLLNNIVAIMMITTHSVIVLLLFCLSHCQRQIVGWQDDEITLHTSIKYVNKKSEDKYQIMNKKCFNKRHIGKICFQRQIWHLSSQDTYSDPFQEKRFSIFTLGFEECIFYQYSVQPLIYPTVSCMVQYFLSIFEFSVKSIITNLGYLGLLWHLNKKHSINLN